MTISWLIYLVSSCIFSYFLTIRFNKKRRKYLQLLVLTILITPTVSSQGLINLTPAVFDFIYGLIFERNISARVLRSLLITVPSSLFLLFLFGRIKRRFFLFLDYLK